MGEYMPIKVVAKSPNFGIGPDETVEVPYWDDLGKKADCGWVGDIDMKLGGKAQIAELDALRKEGITRFDEFDAKLIDAFAKLRATIDGDNWHAPFKALVESQTRIFVRSLNTQYGLFDAQLEALKKEVRAGQELPERLQRVAEKHKDEVAALLQSFIETLTQKANEVGDIHKACVTDRDEFHRELQAIQALLAEAKQLRVKDFEELNEFRKLKQRTESIYAACQEIQTQLNATGESIQKQTKDVIAAREAAAHDAASVRGMMAGCETFVGRLRWLFCGRPNQGPINTTTAE